MTWEKHLAIHLADSSLHSPVRKLPKSLASVDSISNVPLKVNVSNSPLKMLAASLVRTL